MYFNILYLISIFLRINSRMFVHLPVSHSLYIYGSMLSVTLIVEGNRIGNWSSKSWMKLFVSHCSNALREKHEYISSHSQFCPVGWGDRIHRLLLCRGVRPPPTSVLDMTLNNLIVRFQQCWSFGECKVPLHCHCSQVQGVVAPDKGPIYGLNRTKPCFFHYTDFLHLNCIFMLNWIV